MDLKELHQLVMDQAKEKGFGTTIAEVSIPEKIILIHSEVTELFDAYRSKKFEGRDSVGEEMVDIIQRTMHLAGILNIDIEEEMKKKFAINKERTWNRDSKASTEDEMYL